MKKYVIFAIFIISFQLCSAKIVKFSVDMTGQTISPNGVHVSGDFQTEAGFPSDWDSKSTPLVKELGTDIYSVLVTIPAFRRYEYKFVNGDQFYEVEFVPEKSRIGFDFNDNRWVYIDSLQFDTLNLPKLLFGGNAPSGKKMIRFKVDLSLQNTNHTDGVHVGNTLNHWNPKKNTMVSFSGKTYEYIDFTDTGYIEYKFVNGFINEYVDSNCSNKSKNRYISIYSDTVLEAICFSECKECVSKITPPTKQIGAIILYPNPSKGLMVLKISDASQPYSVILNDFRGSEIKRFENVRNELIINTEDLPKGIYFMEVNNQHHIHSPVKFLID